VKKWFYILRAYAFPSSIIPVLLASAVAFRLEIAFSYFYLFLTLLSAVLFHAGTNLINDYYDYFNGVDEKGSDSTTWVLTKGLLTPKKVYRNAIFLFACAMAAGIPLVIKQGMRLIAFGIIGALGGFFYTAPPIAYKYRGWGEVCVFFLMGPFLAMASFMGITGRVNIEIALYSLPLGFLVAAIMYGNNLRDFEGDARRGLKTLAIRLGWKRARWGYAALIAAAYLALILVGIKEHLFPWLAFAFLPLPLFIKNALGILNRRTAEIKTIDIKTAQAYLFFGVIYLIRIFMKG